LKPLQGTTVLDLTHAFAGPLCTYHLQLLGADVIKVERPGVGDEFRHFMEPVGNSKMGPSFIAVNAGKRSLSLDVRKDKGREILHRLVRRSDVLVQNYRPGAVVKMGADWDTARSLNPRLIYCSISGFGQTGELRDWPAYDHTIQAMSGLMSLNGPADPPDPIKVGFTLVDFFCGYTAHSSILAALLQRGLSGKGQHIDVAMLDTALMMMGSPITQYMATGKEPPRVGNRGGRGSAVVTLRTGKGWIFLGANYQPQFEALCRVLGGPELITDARFADHDARVAHEAELARELEQRLSARSAVEWEKLLMEAGCPAGAVRTMAEIVEHPQPGGRNLFVQGRVSGHDQPVGLVNAGYLFEHDGPGLKGPVPAVGEHTDAVLGELGYGAREIGQLHAEGVV
jgi:crotonobetainyl-CoA:carnitine CoA-transferase CaiB-like acyl-CoA transferase